MTSATLPQPVRAFASDVLDLPPGRERDALCRKLLALMLGHPTTRALRDDPRGGPDAAGRLRAMPESDAYATLGGAEPLDPVDAGPVPVSLRAFAEGRREERKRFVDAALATSREASASGDWRGATRELVRALDGVPGGAADALVAGLAELSVRDPLALAYLGRARLTGDGVARDVEAGMSNLAGAEASDDADAAALAASWAAGRLHDAGDLRGALRRYEAAARYGDARCALIAGMTHEIGADGIPAAPAKAAALYRLGTSLGSARCRTRLAVVIGRGQAPAEPGEDWVGMLRLSRKEGDGAAGMALRAMGAASTGR